MLNLKKQEILDLSKKVELNLQKKGAINLPKLDVHLAMDNSGSMAEEFRCGWVQKILELATAAAIKFDDDGNLKFATFNTSIQGQKDVTIDNVENYINNNKIYPIGGTNYLGVFRWALGSIETESKGGFFGMFGKKQTKTKGVYAMCFTDGDAADTSDVVRFLKEKNDPSVFYQWVVIGNQVNTRFLKGLDEQYGNVNFVHIPDPFKLTADDFYDTLLNDEFVKWSRKFSV